MSLLRKSAIGLIAALCSASLAHADTKLSIGFTMNGEAAPIYVAKEQGIFAKHGLDVTLVPIAVNSTLPAALMSDSVQIGTISPTVFLQASQNGLGLTGVSGMTVTSQTGARVGIVAGKNSGITNLKDLSGKTLGIPGVSAVLDIMARRLLIDAGVDVSSINYTETPFPVQSDVLKADTVAAVVTVDPFLSRIEAAGIGKPIANLLDGVPDGELAQFFATTADWAKENPKTVAAFRDAITEAMKVAASDPSSTRKAIGVYVKMPPEMLNTIALPTPDARLTKEQLDWWVEVMRKQGLISASIDTGSLIWKD
ncbi:ABC transporter substrate-binding protein [Mesorhizobium argentiipisi]|uniref:ABC transporter substrate-binding protein n=1 Tax=Mesorhizobium argentiipisi TaxID=3015175 RepID=A0ABU8KHE5_9HYPH